MHYLSRYKVALYISIIIWIASVDAMAQIKTRGSHNFRDFQNKPYYFGLTLGINNSTFRVDHSKNFISSSTNTKYQVVEPSGGMGFTLNMIANLKLGQFFDFRLLPGFSYSDRKLLYTGNLDTDNSRQGKDAFFFELPFHVRYKSQPYKDKRVFLIGGIKYGYDVTANSKSKRLDNLKFSPHDFHVEAGMGLQFFFPYFIFSPEIKFSRGISNTLIYDQDLQQSYIIEGASSQTITLSLHFEG